MTIKYHSQARKEFFQAAEHYEQQVVGLGDDFIYEVEKALELIQQFPYIGSPTPTNERRILVNRFPYGIIYTVEDELIKIFAVMDLRREPNYWKSRR